MLKFYNFCYKQNSSQLCHNYIQSWGHFRCIRANFPNTSRRISTLHHLTELIELTFIYSTVLLDISRNWRKSHSAKPFLCSLGSIAVRPPWILNVFMPYRWYFAYSPSVRSFWYLLLFSFVHSQLSFNCSEVHLFRVNTPTENIAKTSLIRRNFWIYSFGLRVSGDLTYFEQVFTMTIAIVQNLLTSARFVEL